MCVMWHAEKKPRVGKKRLSVYIQNVSVCAGKKSTPTTIFSVGCKNPGGGPGRRKRTALCNT